MNNTQYFEILENNKVMRDRKSKAILAVDKRGLVEALAARSMTDKIQMLLKDVDILKREIQTLKTLCKIN